YVDSASSDGSPELASACGAQVIVVQSERPTAALGRNAGWRATKAEFILFLDGDTIVHPDFPKSALKPMLQDPSIAAVWGHRREIHTEQSIFNRVLDLDWVYAPGFTEFCGGDVLVRRKALEEVGGYDSDLIAGEEPEMCRRMRARGYTILHIDHPMTGHDLQITQWRQYWRRATRAGYAFAEVSRRFRDSDDPSWEADRKRNLVRGGFWAASLIIAVVTSLVLLTPLPLALWAALFVALSLRSAWKARWKSRNVATLLLFGVHSHLQQIPVCIGQLQHALDQKRGSRRALIEYKESSGAKTDNLVS
ncbi:MAG TPA: glycosyltransferase family 2 protein, partial [Silvibacterium sp.]|nr:glycosyltransferase family 2 protein [Silvibacterium sp.]